MNVFNFVRDARYLAFATLLGATFIFSGCPRGTCGDGTVDAGEQCDDGNTMDGDGCSATCSLELPPTCGNGAVDAGEECDDGNLAIGDGCDASCMFEPSVCGDGVISPGEECDDGNNVNGDGCSAACTMEVPGICGDGTVNVGEECDDGNVTPGDGCDDQCMLEPGVCGDGTVNIGEECDDGNTMSGDGCDALCMIEPSPCGDGVLDPGEQCDDGNLTIGDGCDAMCMIEPVACSSPLGTIACGGTDSDDTSVSGFPGWDLYLGCFFLPLNGPEVFYTFTALTTGEVQVDLTGLTVTQLILVIPDFGLGCDVGSCNPFWVTPGGGNNQRVVFTAFAGTTYYFVIEALTPGGGPYTLDVTCASDSVCGNGLLELGEACDDGNTSSGDGCTDVCHPEPNFCGNLLLEAGEQCDDGNTVPGDSCDAMCQFEPIACAGDSGAINCGDVISDDTLASGVDLTNTYPACGPGLFNFGPEQYFAFVAPATEPVLITLTGLMDDLDLFVFEDEGNGCDINACDPALASAAGFINDEQVMLNAIAGTTYYVVVDTETGGGGSNLYDLTLTCASGAVCGNGAVEATEACDDGNTTSGDGCDAMCQLEPNACAGDSGAIACGGMVSGDTGLSGVAAVNAYPGCTFGFTDDGPELYYTFVAPTTETVVIDLTGLSADLDLFVFEDAGAGCDTVTGCVPTRVSAAGGTVDDRVLLDAVAGTTYYVIVESFDVAGGAYDLFVGCPSTAVCGDGVLDPGEACDDGNTVDGDGCGAVCQLEQCVMDLSADLVATPLEVLMFDALAGGDDATVSCAGPVACPGGPDTVIEIDFPAGATDLVMDFDQLTGDVLYALTDPVCIEIECFDPFPATFGTHYFFDVSTGAAPTTFYLIVESCNPLSAEQVLVALSAQ